MSSKIGGYASRPFESIQGTSARRVRYFVVATVILVAAFGQPNGLFLFFPSYLVFSGLIIICSLAYALHIRNLGGVIRLPQSRIWLPLVCFFLLSVCSLVYAPSPTTGVRILGSMTFKVFVCLCVVLLADTEERYVAHVFGLISLIGTVFALQAVLLVFAVAIVGISPIGSVGETSVAGQASYDFQMASYGPLLGFTKVMTQFGSIIVPRAQGLFTEPGWFANFLELSIFATVGLAAIRTRYAGIKPRLLLAIQVLGLFLSFSTAGWFAVAVGAISYASVLYRRRIGIAFIRLMKFAPVVLVIVIVFGLIAPEYAAQIYDVVWTQKFSVAWATEDVGASADQRLRDIRRAWEWYLQRPVFGWGISQLQVVNGGAAANNALLTTLAELGLVGLAVYLWLLVSISLQVRTMTRLSSSSNSGKLWMLAAATSGMMTSLIVHSMFVETQWNFFYWLGVAACITVARFVRSELHRQQPQVTHGYTSERYSS